MWVCFFDTCLNSREKGSSDDVLRGIKAKVELRSLDARRQGREIGWRASVILSEDKIGRAHV